MLYAQLSLIWHLLMVSNYLLFYKKATSDYCNQLYLNAERRSKFMDGTNTFYFYSLQLQKNISCRATVRKLVSWKISWCIHSSVLIMWQRTIILINIYKLTWRWRIISKILISVLRYVTLGSLNQTLLVVL